jgi:hypothetical protein
MRRQMSRAGGVRWDHAAANVEDVDDDQRRVALVWRLADERLSVHRPSRHRYIVRANVLSVDERAQGVVARAKLPVFAISKAA